MSNYVIITDSSCDLPDSLVKELELDNVVFTGRIDVRDYLGRMDMTILTSISEGQPLTILESYAARKPVIATDVGNCRELIYGENDTVTPPYEEGETFRSLIAGSRLEIIPALCHKSLGWKRRRCARK